MAKVNVGKLCRGPVGRTLAAAIRVADFWQSEGWDFREWNERAFRVSRMASQQIGEYLEI